MPFRCMPNPPRATKDLDLLIKPDGKNAAALYAALQEFGAPLKEMKPEDFIERGKFFRMGSPPVMVDILPEISGVDFDQAWQRRFEATVDAKTGLKAQFISEADLIASKLAVGRPQDLADVDAIHKAKRRGAGGNKPKHGRATKKPPPKP